MITIEQIKAARALLNLKQSDLAKAAGLSLTSLNNIERGVTSPRMTTLKAIQLTLEGAGIEFIANDGICRRRDTFNVNIYEGAEAVTKFLEDAIETLPNGGDYMIIGLEERNFIERNKKALDQYFIDVEKHNIHEKSLLCEGDMNFYSTTPNTEYRWVSKEVFSNAPYSVYGNKCAILTWGNPDRLIIIENQVIADSARRQFMAHWENAVIPNNRLPVE